MKHIFNWILVALPLLVVFSCCLFFNSAFNKTMKQCDNIVPLVQVSVENDCTKRAVLNLLCKDSVKNKVSDALTNREQIVENEHTRFRAELATWLSVFGMLTIVVTLVVPVCAHLLQQREFRNEIDTVKALLEKSERKFAENFTNMEKRFKEIEKNVDMAETAKTAADEARSAAENAAEAAKWPEELDSADSDDQTLSWTDAKLKSMLYKFKIIWGADNEEQKLEAGIDLFEKCNKDIGEALNNGDVEKLVKCINVLNNVNAYIGTRNLEKFRSRFIKQLKAKRPIQYSPEQVADVLKGRHPQSGFFAKIWELQTES